MEKEKKNNKKKIIIIISIILGVLLVGVLSYITYDKAFKKDNEVKEEVKEEINNEEQEVENIDVDVKDRIVTVEDRYTFVKKDVKYTGSFESCTSTYDININVPIIKANYSSKVIDELNNEIYSKLDYKYIENNYTNLCDGGSEKYEYLIYNNVLYLTYYYYGGLNNYSNNDYNSFGIFYDIINDKKLTPREALLKAGYTEKKLSDLDDDINLDNDMTSNNPCDITMKFKDGKVILEYGQCE